jgi:hypothetical protein
MNTGQKLAYGLLGAPLAMSTGLGLPFLAALGYQPGGAMGLTALAVLYAGIPYVIKLLSAMLLLRWRSCLEVQRAA